MRALNAGTCLLTAEGPKCRCPWRYNGSFCESEKSVRNPRFQGHSYLFYRISGNYTAKDMLEIKIQIRPEKQNGLVAYVHNENMSVYLAVYMERSALKFRFSCGFHQMSFVETKENMSTGYPQTIDIRIVKTVSVNATATCFGSVSLNQSYTMHGEQKLNADGDFSWPDRLYLGGKASGIAFPPEINFLPGFVGCIYLVEQNGVALRLWDDAVKGKAIEECHIQSNDKCGAAYCLNGGVCSGSRAHCECLTGYSGRYCERKQCLTNLCLNGATCVPVNDKQICLCPLGKTGPLCNTDFDLSRPQFLGSFYGYASYLAVDTPPFIDKQFELKFHFITNDATQISLLLFVGQTEVQFSTNSSNNFLAITFIKGHVALTWDLGSGPRRIFTALPVDVEATGGHSVYVGRYGRSAWLQVDQQPMVTGRSPGIRSSLNVDSPIFLGGHFSYNHSELPSDLPLHSGFRGCIYDVIFRSRGIEETVHWTPTVIDGRSVTQCAIPLCRLNGARVNSVEQHGSFMQERLTDDGC